MNIAKLIFDSVNKKFKQGCRIESASVLLN